MEPTLRVLIVEDDHNLGAEIQRALTQDGYDVTWMTDGADASHAQPDHYHAIILDLMLPGRHGFDLLKLYRQSSDVPILILTARKDTFDKVRGFELGGDDYLTKPFWPEELLARLRARLRRPSIQRAASRAFGALTLDLEGRQVCVRGEPVELTRVEFDLLAVLAQRPGAAISRRQLVERALDEEREGTERTLDVHISRIRKKLGPAGKQIATVWGVGYRLLEAEPAPSADPEPHP